MCCALNSSEAPNERSLWRRQGCGAREHVRITLGKMLAVPRRPCLRVFRTEHVAPTIDDGAIRGPIRAVMGPSNEAWHYPQAMIDGLSDLVNQREEILRAARHEATAPDRTIPDHDPGDGREMLRGMRHSASSMCARCVANAGAHVAPGSSTPETAIDAPRSM